MISNFVASKIEDEFQTVDNLQSSRTGLMFGAKLVGKFKDVTIKDPVLLANAKEFTRQCFIRPWIMGNILGKRAEAESSDDLLTFMRTNKANNFGIYYKNQDGSVIFKTCSEITDPLLSAIEKEAKSSKILGSFGMALGGPKDSLQILAKRLSKTGNDALNILAKGTGNVHDFVKQSMMLNVYRESLDDWRESAGYQRIWPEVISMNATRGLFQQSLGWMRAGEMAAQFLPLLQTMMFLIVVSSIVVVFPMSMWLGGFEILKVWLQGLIWVHTWPIFFAIINSIGMHILAAKSGVLGQSYGLTKATQYEFSDMLIHTYALVQMFASMIPVISWMLISKSAYAFSGMVERVSTFAPAGALGSATVDNTLAIDNVSFGNRQLHQQTVGPNLDMGSSINSGIVKVSQSENGSQIIEERVSQLATNYRGSTIESIALNDSYMQQSSKLQSLNQRESSLASLEQSQFQDYAQRWLQSHDASSANNQTIIDSMRAVASDSFNSSENFSARESKSNHTSTKLDSSAGIKILGTGTTISTSTGASNTNDVSHDSSAQQALSYQEALENVRNYAKTHDLRNASGTSENISQSLQKTWKEQDQIAKEKANTMQTMASIQSQISYLQQNQATVDENWNDKVLDSVKDKYGYANKTDALEHLHANPNEGQQIVKELVAQKYGNMSGQVTSRGQNLANEAQNTDLSISGYEKGAQSLKVRYNENSDSELTDKYSVVKTTVEDSVNQARNPSPDTTNDLQKIKEGIPDSKAQNTQKYEKRKNEFDRQRGTLARTRDEFKTTKEIHDKVKNNAKKAIGDIKERFDKVDNQIDKFLGKSKDANKD
jgi:conjugal transfer mating pair stabilization protein TraG